MDNEIIPYEDDFDIEKSVPEPVVEFKLERGRKSNLVQFTQRLDEAVEMVLYKNLSYGEFIKLYTQTYTVSRDMAREVWKKVKEVLRQRSLDKADEIIAKQMARYIDLLERARLDGNKRVEREVLWDISRISGLDQRKLDITSNGEKLDIKINLSNNPNDFNV
jgi:hypothetical protein